MPPQSLLAPLNFSLGCAKRTKKKRIWWALQVASGTWLRALAVLAIGTRAVWCFQQCFLLFSTAFYRFLQLRSCAIAALSFPLEHCFCVQRGHWVARHVSAPWFGAEHFLKPCKTVSKNVNLWGNISVIKISWIDGHCSLKGRRGVRGLP